MANFFSTSQVQEFLMKNINDTMQDMTPEDILSTLLDKLSDLTSESLDKRSLYTGRDIQDLRDYLVNQVMTLTDQWTDFNESDVGMVLIELIAGLGDMLGFYLDKQTLECYITDVKQRKNGSAILKLIGYEMFMTNSCVTTGRFVISEPYETDVLIPRYTQVSAQVGSDNIRYATKYDVSIPAGADEAEVPLIQGEVHTSYISVNELKNNQKIQLAATDVANNSVIITIDGQEWTQVPDVVVDDVPGRKYSVFEDKHCVPYIYFHNSYKDYLPADTSVKAEIKFLVSLGPNGKIKAGLIDKIDTEIMHDGVNISSDIEVTNTDISSGGSTRETLDHARVQAPKSLSMLGKAITLSDYKDMALSIPGVLKCSPLDWSVDSGKYVSVPYQVDIYIVPTDAGDASTEQLTEIHDYFNDSRIVSSMTVNVYSAKYQTVDITARVYAVIAESRKESLRSSIETRIKEYFRPENLEFGSGIQPSNISTLIETTSEAIDYVELDEPSGTSTIDLTQFPQLGELHIEVIRTSTRSTD